MTLSNRAGGTWRAMQSADLPTVASISDIVHGDYTEDISIYAERLALCPTGCAVFARDGVVIGYCIAHPWQGATPPALGTLIGALAGSADSYYLHDLALLPGERGSGAGKAALALVEQQASAADLACIMLTAVNGAESFWAAQGFVPCGTRPYGDGTVLMRRFLAEQ